MWVPWAKELAAKLESVSNQNIAHKVFMTLGVCHKTLKIQPGTSSLTLTLTLTFLI